MSEKSVVIVGAGMAGLSAGCYARMNGFKALILEMHRIPGGLCAAWKRKGYTFDISMHWLAGSKSGALYQMWQELGVIENRRFHYHDEMYRIESGRRTLSFCIDPERLLAQMLELSPADEKLSRDFVRLLTGPGFMGLASLKPPETSGLFDRIGMMFRALPLVGVLRKCGKQTVQGFAARFTDPFLREAVRMAIDAPGWRMLRFPLVGMAGAMRSSVAEGGVPIGGSQQVAFTIAERFKQLGGEARYNCLVTGILVENNRAAGVKLADGSEVRADTVIWAADGHKLIFDILDSRYIDERIRRMYSEWVPVRPIVQVCLGVNRDMSKEPARLAFELTQPVTVAGETRKWLSVIHHSFDPTMAPEGKSAVEVWFPCRYGYWQALEQDRPRYDAEKQRIADLTIAELDQRWPGFRKQVEVLDVATPATYVRYTGNWLGSPDGWYMTPENMRAEPLRNLPGLEGLWLAGQWTAPFTGTVLAALTGRQVVELVCRRHNRRFRAAS
ncbi:MAG: NAD(P)/FAD-dependent oxidoreductase [candidate division WOR-3 bacterium]|nr:MAG: NAD(P)/FAD-dependent oxidoreductase [candidate division WOR-3 bacterium]